MTINRDRLLNRIKKAFKVHRIVCLLGPKQSGKTILADFIKLDYEKVHYYNLERYADLRAFDTPDFTLYRLRGLIVIKDIHRKPDLFPYLRYLHDEHFDQKFLIIGSADRNSIGQSSESLAGRISHIQITPFSLNEVQDLEKLWIKGGFPQSYLLDQEESLLWREKYMQNHVERDLKVLGFEVKIDVLTKIWLKLADFHGSIINYSTLAYELEIPAPIIKKYISYLQATFMLRILKPWHENLNKRQIKSPKIYYRDSGLLHYVLDIKKYSDILTHPKMLFSFESFAMEEVIKFHHLDKVYCYFWTSQNKAKLDLLLLNRGTKLGFNFSLLDRPKLTPSMRIVMKDLKLDSLTIIYRKGESYMLAKNIKVISLEEYVNTN